MPPHTIDVIKHFLCFQDCISIVKVMDFDGISNLDTILSFVFIDFISNSN